LNYQIGNAIKPKPKENYFFERIKKQRLQFALPKYEAKINEYYPEVKQGDKALELIKNEVQKEFGMMREKKYDEATKMAKIKNPSIIF
jgi:hypothetical protein